MAAILNIGDLVGRLQQFTNSSSVQVNNQPILDVVSSSKGKTHVNIVIAASATDTGSTIAGVVTQPHSSRLEED